MQIRPVSTLSSIRVGCRVAIVSLALAGAGLVVGSAVGADADAGPSTRPDDGGFVPLFDGKTLDGWVVTGCKADVEDGKLVILEGNGLVRTEKVYGDFILELEWKNRKPEKYDSGVFFRAALPQRGPWPARYQVNLLQGQEGSLVGHPQGKAGGLARGGEWNKLRLKAVGATAEVEVNGKQAWKVDDIQEPAGVIALQVETPGGGQFEFRNIRILPLTPPTTLPTAPATRPGGSSVQSSSG